MHDIFYSVYALYWSETSLKPPEKLLGVKTWLQMLVYKKYNYMGQGAEMQIGVVVRQTFLGGRRNLVS